MSEHLKQLESLLPDYASGLVWALAIGGIWAMSMTPEAASIRVRELIAIVDPLDFPEVAVTFLLIVFGVLLPYALAMIFAPFSSATANEIYKRWYTSSHFYSGLSSAYLKIGSVASKKF